MKLVPEITQEISSMFSTYVSNPAAIGDADRDRLSILSNKFPYCQLLHAFISRSMLNNQKFEKSLSRASIYSPDRGMLYMIVNHPERLSIAKTEAEVMLFANQDNVEHDYFDVPISSMADNLCTEISVVKEDLMIASEEIMVANDQQEVTMKSYSIITEETSDQDELVQYEDDSIPFSFLWWLNKTRKAHRDTYPQFPLKELENQRQDVETLTFKRKEEVVLDAFLREDFHAKPLKFENLPTDNKDHVNVEYAEDVVSETLAKIYTKQLLFAKAIATYKKLILRFPEKNTYFIGLIRSLEQQTNN